MKPRLAFLAVGFAALVRGEQSVGSDNITTVATATCTTTGTQTYAFVDTASVTYQYMCGGGAGGGSQTTVLIANVTRWQDCFGFTDNYIGTNNCTGFTYNSGQPFGNGPGQCQLKYGGQSFASTATLLSTRVAGLMTRVVVKPAPTFSCPAVNSQAVVDPYGQQYAMQCGYDTSGNSNTNQGQLVQASNSFNDCFALCDIYSYPGQGNCTGWQYSGKPDGVGSGNCYLKVVQPAPKFNTVYNQNYVGAIRLAGNFSSTSSPSSALATTTDLGFVSTKTDAAYPSSTSSSLSSSSSSVSSSLSSSSSSSASSSSSSSISSSLSPSISSSANLASISASASSSFSSSSSSSSSNSSSSSSASSSSSSSASSSISSSGSSSAGLASISASVLSSSPSSSSSSSSSSTSSFSSSSLSSSSSSSASSPLSSSSSGANPPSCSSTVTVSVTWTPPSRAELYTRWKRLGGSEPTVQGCLRV